MQCARQQPNRTGFWFPLPNKRQKHVMMVKPYPTLYHLQQPKVSVFITSSLCPTTNEHLFQKRKKRFNRQSQYTTHIYSTKQTSNKSSKKQNGAAAKYFGMLSKWADLMSEIPFLLRSAEVRCEISKNT
jgi:hypothetical protein